MLSDRVVIIIRIKGLNLFLLAYTNKLDTLKLKLVTR